MTKIPTSQLLLGASFFFILALLVVPLLAALYMFVWPTFAREVLGMGPAFPGFSNHMIKEEFWDQDGILVKEMNTTEIEHMDGRNVATRMRMNKLEAEQEWTEMSVQTVDFDVELSPNLFTLSNLRNPRQ